MRYFRLHPWVFLIKGTCKALIIDTNNRSILWISSISYNILYDAELNKPISEKDLKFFYELQAEGLGKLYSQRTAIDKLRVFNVFNEKKFHKNTPKIEISVLQLTNECDVQCPNCTTRYCNSCVLKDENETDLSQQEWFSIIDNLIIHGLKSVILTGGEPLLYKYFDNIVNYLLQKGINVTVHTHGLIKYQDDIKFNVVVSLFNYNHFPLIKDNYENLEKYTILNCTNEVIESGRNYEVRNISHNMNPQKLVSLNLADYYIKKLMILA